MEEGGGGIGAEKKVVRRPGMREKVRSLPQHQHYIGVLFWIYPGLLPHFTRFTPDYRLPHPTLPFTYPKATQPFTPNSLTRE